MMQVIGNLMKKPIILADNKYIITKNDFDLPLARNIFLAIDDLFKGYNAETITIVDIDNYFQQTEGSYENFKP